MGRKERNIEARPLTNKILQVQAKQISQRHSDLFRLGFPPNPLRVLKDWDLGCLCMDLINGTSSIRRGSYFPFRRSCALLAKFRGLRVQVGTRTLGRKR